MTRYHRTRLHHIDSKNACPSGVICTPKECSWGMISERLLTVPSVCICKWQYAQISASKFRTCHIPRLHSINSDCASYSNAKTDWLYVQCIQSRAEWLSMFVKQWLLTTKQAKPALWRQQSCMPLQEVANTVNSPCKDTWCKDNLHVRTMPLATNHCILNAVIPLSNNILM